MTNNKNFSTQCPIPIQDHPKILLGHGSGGKLMRQLIEKMFLSTFKNPFLEKQHDGAVLNLTSKKIAFTTDSYVVHPIFFPGGDIGSMAVYGTVNDLAMCGAKPLYLSASFIIEEGFLMEELWRVVQSMKRAADETGVSIVTGDTKVVNHGKGDGIFINTSGVGVIEHELEISPKAVRAGDVVLLSGDVGRHGVAVMASREGLEFETTIKSDLAPLDKMVQSILEAGIEIHCLRDLTRGGLTSGLVEIANSACLSIRIDDAKVLVADEVRGACEILGLDPYYVANEGRFIVFVSRDDAKKTCQVMKKFPAGQNACEIGSVEKLQDAPVVVKNQIGTTRILEMLSGEQLPRIC
jgi:hydrogenase expression/formation protein HypE